MKPAIIIPTYDNLEGLKKLIRQLRGFDVYVIEDGVKSETVKWLRTQKKLHLILHNENNGVAVSWNEGLKEAIQDECTHFAVFNDDIELYPNWWEECKKAFDGGAELVTLTEGQKLKMTPRAVPIAGWFFILSRSVIEKVGLFDEGIGKFIGEDTDYGIRCGLNGIKYALLDLPIKHHSSVTIKKLDSELVEQARATSFQYLRTKYPYLRFTI